MSQSGTHATESQKRKRGEKSRHILVEGDDDTVDIVTFKDVMAKMPRGLVKKRVEVPLRPAEDLPRTLAADIEKN
jgi:hypothetical protein